jgi:hypothetical protein
VERGEISIKLDMDELHKVTTELERKGDLAVIGLGVAILLLLIILWSSLQGDGSFSGWPVYAAGGVVGVALILFLTKLRRHR